MNIRAALKSQYHSSLAMLKQTIERCPDDLWTGGDGPRFFWRIAYHALFFTHLYLQPDESTFVRWEKHIENPDSPDAVPHTKQELLEYWSICDAMIDDGVDRLDLDAQECGFWWYHMPKLDHQMMNIRHIQEHAGQLAERCRAAGVDLDWVGLGP